MATKLALTREQRVDQFLVAAQQDVSFELAWACMIEECKELADAAREYEAAEKEGTNGERVEARKNLVKEWADVQYVLSQLALFYGIDGEKAFDIVAANNMTKIEGGVRRREDGKILKPDNYVKADMSGL